LITELALTSKCSATSRREAPDLTSSIARSRKSPEYGLGIEFPPANQIAVGRIVHCSDVGNPLRFDYTGIRSNYLTVTLERGIREDDAEPLIEAIKLIRGVVNVAINADDPESFSAESRVKSELQKKLWELLKLG
jgi:hypothetical protein